MWPVESAHSYTVDAYFNDLSKSWFGEQHRPVISTDAKSARSQSEVRKVVMRDEPSASLVPLCSLPSALPNLSGLLRSPPGDAYMRRESVNGPGCREGS